MVRMVRADIGMSVRLGICRIMTWLGAEWIHLWFLLSFERHSYVARVLSAFAVNLFLLYHCSSYQGRIPRAGKPKSAVLTHFSTAFYRFNNSTGRKILAVLRDYVSFLSPFLHLSPHFNACFSHF
jgi:hypothetical protein